MARRRSIFPRRGKKGGNLTAVVVLLAVGFLVSLVQQYWPIFLAVGGFALIGYLWKFATDKSAQAPIVLPTLTTTTERVGPGHVEISVSMSPIRPRKVTVDPDSIWVPAGRSVTVAGNDIGGGLFYVGKGLPPVSGWRAVEPALIDPSLPVEPSLPDRDPTDLPYWPSYSDVSPACRGAYLHWLASGRQLQGANIGYVFLFFYGLERRLLADAQHSESARHEREAILLEIERLLQIYSHHRSFLGYAGALLGGMRAAYTTRRLYELAPPAERTGNELPDTLRVGVAQLALDGKPIPVDWAWAWLTCHPDVSLRTPATRCAGLFRQLFEVRYRQRFGPGLTITPNKTKLTINYRPASASFGETVCLPVGDLPDVTALSGPLQKLRALADQCTDEMDAYSRWLGRNPDSDGTLAAAALLPRDLLAVSSSGALQRLRQWLENNVDARTPGATIRGADLIRFWREDTSKLAKADAVGLAQIIEKLGFGLEPDVRFGGPALDAETKAVVFRLTDEPPTAPSPAYTAATLGLHLAAMVAAADDCVSAEEAEHFEQHLESALHTSTSERQRLRAHLAWLLATQPRLTGLKKRIEALSDAQRRSLTRLLVAIAGADGRFDPEEITTLTKIYKLLGFSAAEVYSDVHGQSTSGPATEPITIRPAEARAGGFAIPQRPSREPVTGPVELDVDRIQAKLAETAAVSALLADVFTEDGHAPVPEPPKPAQGLRIGGLDETHSRLARELSARAKWSRSAIEALAATLGLMPDGALEKINDMAFEHCGEPLCEGEDPVEVNITVAQEFAK